MQLMLLCTHSNHHCLTLRSLSNAATVSPYMHTHLLRVAGGVVVKKKEAALGGLQPTTTATEPSASEKG